MKPYEKARAVFEAYAGVDGDRLPTDDNSALQVRLMRWQQKCLPSSPLPNDIVTTLGVAEEIGELASGFLGVAAAGGKICHVALKTSQGIRGYDDREKGREAIADAVADISIFLRQLCTSWRLDYWTLVECTADEVMKRNWKADPTKGGLK